MKFRTKIAICMIWLLSLAYGIGGSMLISGAYRASLERETDAARRSCQMLINTLAVVQSNSDLVPTLRQLDRGQTEWCALALYSGDSQIYASGEFPGGTLGGEILRVADGYILIACDVGSGLVDLRLEAAYDITPIELQRAEQLRAYRWTFLTVAAVGTVLSWALCSWLTQPLRALTRVSRELADGNLQRRVRVTSQDEVGQLSAEFNAMADKLQTSMDGMKSAMERQEEFMGSFAHELKTPMTSIIGYADLLRSQELTEQDRREAANYVFSENLCKVKSRLIFNVLKQAVYNLDNLSSESIKDWNDKTLQNMANKSSKSLYNFSKTLESQVPIAHENANNEVTKTLEHQLNALKNRLYFISSLLPELANRGILKIISGKRVRSTAATTA